MIEEIADRLEGVRATIEKAARRAARSANDVELIAVSKGHDADKVRLALGGDQLLFGESRVQEARAKIPLLPSNLRWHFIGHLQKNKIRHALPLFELIHSVDTLDLAQQLNRVAAEDGFHPRILLEVNLAGEGSKFGWRPEALNNAMEELLSLDRLSIEGLMTIPPLAEDAEASRPYFVLLHNLRDQLETAFRLKLPQLSMGMSGDFAVAIEEGATLVRVGTAIFGPRSRSKSISPPELL
ncbi:MAG: YggS family pyridoxal phosphate-dependent enzyme [Chthoniobacterales bacterium]